MRILQSMRMIPRMAPSSGWFSAGCIFAIIAFVSLTTTVAQEPAKDMPSDSVSEKVATPEAKKNNDEVKKVKPAPSKASQEGWPLFRGDASSTGVAKTSLPEELTVLWQYQVKGKRDPGFEGTPIVVKNQSNGKKTVYIGDMDGVVFSIDFETGKKNWEFDTGLGISASPAWNDGRIFIGDIDGYFWCLNEAGEQQWKFQCNAEVSGSANFYGEGVLFGSHDSKLYLLNQKTGEKIWEVETPDQIQCSATVHQGRGFVAGCDAYLHLIDLKEGKEVGKVEIHSPTRSTPAVRDGLAIFGTEQDSFFAIDLAKVEMSWAFADQNGSAAVRGSAAVGKNNVVFGARNRKVYSLDPSNGKEQWATQLKAKIDASPVIVGDRVFVGSTDGRLYGLSLSDGKPIWEKQFKGGFIGSPAVAFDRLVVATDRGLVYCLGKAK